VSQQIEPLWAMQFAKKHQKEVITILSNGIAVVYLPNGSQSNISDLTTAQARYPLAVTPNSNQDLF